MAPPPSGPGAVSALAPVLAGSLLLVGLVLLLLARLGAPLSGGRPGRPRESGALLPPSPSGLFPPSHHEKLHDEKYLRRMLEAERQQSPGWQDPAPEGRSEVSPEASGPDTHDAAEGSPPRR